MRTWFSLIPCLPLLIFGGGAFLYVETQNEAHVQLVRAEGQWRKGNYARALEMHARVYRDHPKSRYADEALWEMATINYVNFYRIDRAVSYLQTLLAEYPASPLARDAKLRLAEIHEGEIADIPQAIRYWQQVLAADSPRQLRRQILFKMANAYFKANRFEEARAQLEAVLEEGKNDHLADQSRIRAGTIRQIQKQYAKSTGAFHEVLRATQCRDCRVQAQRGLIESYEFMGELGNAIRTADTMRDDEYPVAMKQGLLRRLKEKKKALQPHGR